jgi:hypothetical protein
MYIVHLHRYTVWLKQQISLPTPLISSLEKNLMFEFHNTLKTEQYEIKSKK